MSRILVVEDDPAILRGLADNLRFESYEVLTASDGQAGYRLIHEKNPDLILLDLMLPGLSGHTLCRKVRDEGVTTPILMLTAQAEEEDRVQGLDLGANDYVTKPFSVRELLARIRATLRHGEERAREQAFVDQEMRVAAEVQQRLFPQSLPALRTLDYAAVCQPARGVSGDYYDCLELGQGRLGLLVADVVGKGISAALLMASLQACIRSEAPLLGESCAELVTRANALLHSATSDERFATLFYAVYDDETRLLTYANAGHEYPLVLRLPVGSRPVCLRLESGSLPIGIAPDLAAKQESLQLLPGDWLVIFSDGVTEARNESGEEFGQARICEAILSDPKRKAEEARDTLLLAVAAHSGGPGLSDDLTLLVAHVL